MIKEYQTITGVSKFIKSFGDSLSLIYDSYLVNNDLIWESEYIQDWAKNKAYLDVPYIIYIRKHGAFSPWYITGERIKEEKETWKNQIVGTLKITRNKETKKFEVEFIKDEWL